MLDEWTRQGERLVTPTDRVHRLLDAVEAAGVTLVCRAPEDGARWPSQPLVNGDAAAALERLAQALAELAAERDTQQAAAAAGPGTAEAVIGARLGDPTPDRLDAHGDLRDTRGTVGARLGDQGEVTRLADLHRDVCHHIDNEATWLTGQIWPYRDARARAR